MMTLNGVPISVDLIRTNGRNGNVATRDTLNKMAQVARSCARGAIVPQVADSILSTSSPSELNPRSIIRRVYYFVKGRIVFEPDEQILMEQFGFSSDRANDTELIISPDALLMIPEPKGDCDCFSTLIASLLVCMNIPVRFVAIAIDPKEPNRFSHVFCRALVDGQWIGMDASHGMYPGWETDRFRYRELEWNV